MEVLEVARDDGGLCVRVWSEYICTLVHFIVCT